MRDSHARKALARKMHTERGAAMAEARPLSRPRARGSGAARATPRARCLVALVVLVYAPVARAVECYAVGGTTSEDTLCTLPFYVQSRVENEGTSILVGKAFQACAPIQLPHQPFEVTNGSEEDIRKPNRSGTNLDYWCPTGSFYSNVDASFRPTWGYCSCEGDDFSWPTPSPTTPMPTAHPTREPTTRAPTASPTSAPTQVPTLEPTSQAPTTGAPTFAPISSAPASAPITEAPVTPISSETPSPSLTPITPETPSPSSTPITPETPSPSSTHVPTTTAPTMSPTIACSNNGIQDNDETDVDCGGQACDPCVEGEMCELDSDCMQNTLCVNEGRCRAIVNVTYVNIVAQASENLRSASLAVTKSLQEGVSEALQNSSLQASSVVIEPSDADTSTPLCTTDGGWVSYGSSCAFPFTFQGRTYASCVDVEDATPYWGNETTAPPGTPPVLYRVYWCPTIQDYSKSDPATREQWGYCDCGRSWPTAYPTARPTTHAPTIELEKDRPIWCDEALRNENTTQDLQAQVLSALQGNATTSEASGFMFNLQGPLSGLGDEVGAEDPQEGDLTVALVIDVDAQEITSREDFLESLASTLIEALRTPFRNETLHEICDAVS